MNGDTTLVAMSVVPAGSLASSGSAISVNSSLAYTAQGTNATSSASIAFMSRSRSSSRCDISVPSARSSAFFSSLTARGDQCRHGDRRAD
jgi:hypothetical protein